MINSFRVMVYIGEQAFGQGKWKGQEGGGTGGGLPDDPYAA